MRKRAESDAAAEQPPATPGLATPAAGEGEGRAAGAPVQGAWGEGRPAPVQQPLQDEGE